MTPEQLLLYARDLNRVVEIERAQAPAAAAGLPPDGGRARRRARGEGPGTSMHAQRVQHYAITLTEVVNPGLLDDPSLEYGFLLHDVGKIGIADQFLNKPGR